MNKLQLTTFFLLLLLSSTAASSPPPLPAQKTAPEGTRWAILVAGSGYYYNYRHQADVCHAYHILKKGGLRDDNIVVFMSDDVAFSVGNPRPGILINKPTGSDVYSGVPKDYTGSNCTADNFYAVILGNRSALTGGSGKVVDSGPDDTVFIYYADHGSAGLVGMPVGKSVYAHDLMEVLKKKHTANAYKSMVIYMEACEAGSMFDGVLPGDMNIYAVTASNTSESSYAFYCPGDYPAGAPPDFQTCLGDLFSISWLEDSDLHDPRKETLEQQYHAVRRRTAMDSENSSSHVMQYGDKTIAHQLLSFYIGFDDGAGATTSRIISTTTSYHDRRRAAATAAIPRAAPVSQRDAVLVHLQQQEKAEAEMKLEREIFRRKQADERITRIGDMLLGGHETAVNVMNSVRPSGHPLVDDWDCFKSFVETYEEKCEEKSSEYGKKYSRALANMCNAGVTLRQLIAACKKACPNNKLGKGMVNETISRP
ncbi:unnamed protein product [Linum tenue]|uniref:Legumain prodomain domain-containing protein n=1 Tax=Linum tenue TaxID=586396 RepID=A0AAV0L6K8_9ROSI|nr:unnamed protein product [Linum tenue]